MAVNKKMTAEYVTVVLPSGIFGSSQQYKNHDPKRIEHVQITENEVQLRMTKQHCAQTVAEFESYLTTFQQQVNAGEADLQYSAYERVEYEENYRVIRLYLTAEQYFQHSFLEINELELVIDALHHQMYSGLAPSVTFEYIDLETDLELGKITYP